MKTFTCHKVVQAAAIIGINRGAGIVEVVGESDPERITVPEDFFARGEPTVWDYLVKYQDGYLSWSPKKVFEDGYSEGSDQAPQSTVDICFGSALAWIKAGKRVARAGWNGKDMDISLQSPDASSKMTLPYIFMKTARGENVPWVASQTDLLADDWRVVD